MSFQIIRIKIERGNKGRQDCFDMRWSTHVQGVVQKDTRITTWSQMILDTRNAHMT